MSKSNLPPKKKGAQIRKPLDARVSFLYQASTYFAGVRLSNISDTGQAAFDRLQEDQKQVDLTASAHMPISNQSIELDLEPKEIATKESSKPPLVFDESSTRLMLSQLKGISRKSSTRIPSGMKRSICKRCDLLLIHGRTSSQRLENKSRGGKKPWADVLVITCNSCGTAKHIPVGAKRQPRRKDRSSKSKEHTSAAPTSDVTSTLNRRLVA
ncbi:MAG: hypothetical protein Q9224_005854 [Gallowayella concinna]